MGKRKVRQEAQIRAIARAEVERVLGLVLGEVERQVGDYGVRVAGRVEGLADRMGEMLEVHGRLLGLLASVEVMLLGGDNWAVRSFRAEWDLISSGLVVAAQAEAWLREQGEGGG